MGEERFIRDFDEELGDFLRDRSQAGGKAAGEQRDGELGDGRGGHGDEKAEVERGIRQFEIDAGRGNSPREAIGLECDVDEGLHGKRESVKEVVQEKPDGETDGEAGGERAALAEAGGRHGGEIWRT